MVALPMLLAHIGFNLISVLMDLSKIVLDLKIKKNLRTAAVEKNLTRSC